MPETAQFLLYSLNYLLFSSCADSLSCGDQNKIKQICPLVKPDFSLCRLFVMLWPQHMCTDPSHWGLFSGDPILLLVLTSWQQARQV